MATITERQIADLLERVEVLESIQKKLSAKIGALGTDQGLGFEQIESNRFAFYHGSVSS